MAALLTITLLLLCCSVSASGGKCDYNVATGADFTVPLEQNIFIKIVWMHNGKKIFDGRVKDGKITVVTGHERDISPNGFLKLTKLDKSKAGTYTSEVFDLKGRLTEVKKKLCVLDPVTKPTVKVQCGQKPKESQVTFTCSFGDQENPQIGWLKNKEVIKNKTAPTLKEDGENVKSDSFSCNVSNDVSFMVSEPVTQTCFKSPFSFFHDKVMGVQIWIIIASGGGVVLLLILTIIVCCIMNKRKRRMNLKDEEELRLDWTNTEQQQQHHHSHNPNHKHHHHNPPPGHHQHQEHQHQSAGHTGPRQNRSRQQREQRPRLPEPPGSHPQPSPRRAAQGPGPAVNHDDEQPPPLPQPRKKAPL